MIRLLNVYYPTRTVLLLLCEMLIVSSCFVAATFGLLQFDEAIIALNFEYGWLKVVAVTTMSLLLSYYFDLYEPELVSAREEIYLRVLLVLGFGCVIVAVVTSIFPEAQIGYGLDARPVYAVGYALLAPALFLWRRVYEWIISRKLFRERVFVLGGGAMARSIVETIRSRPYLGMDIVDWQEVGGEPEERKQFWIRKLASIASPRRTIDRIIIAVEAQLDGLRISTLLYADGFRVHASQQLARQILATLVAATGLLLLLPLFPVVILLVRLSSKGPIFFSQTRVGLNGKTFRVHKFRSMFIDAESGGARWATKNDPRVTKLGMFMRKTRIDELPQLWNVLKGDMGFVGPRPERPEFVPMLAENLPFFHLRHLIRPGLTGWAQVRYGYGATLAEAREKLEFDLYYVKHMSLGLALLIMFETIKTIIRRRGAQ